MIEKKKIPKIDESSKLIESRDHRSRAQCLRVDDGDHDTNVVAMIELYALQKHLIFSSIFHFKFNSGNNWQQY